jgi:glycosyltransferase involved in cell wall biosynthesis
MELIRALARRDRDNEYVLFFDSLRLRRRVVLYAELDHAPNFRTRLLPYGVFSPWAQLSLPHLLKRLRLDVFHSPNYMIPFLAFPPRRAHPVRCVVTIHDVIPLLFRDHAPRSRKARLFPLYRRLMLEVGRRADVILTVSESSREDTLRELDLPPERAGDVIVVPNGVAPEYKPAARKGSRKRTVLYVGRSDPYKNVTGLLRTFARVRKLSGGEVQLRVIGPQDSRYPEPRRVARELEVDRRIVWSGYASGRKLIGAYQQADVFVLLSKYEGFGLPVLEAMACGTPVVCSNRSSLPEVAGDAALLVDPDDEEAAARAIVRVLDEPGLAERLIERGRRRAAEFTWDRTAAATLAAYQRAARIG